MQVVINISHNLYESIIKDYDLSELGRHELYKAVQKGKPLPATKDCDTCKHKDKKYQEFPCVDCLEKDRYEEGE